ncbi:MAG: pilus assembly protein TadG-related protein [Microthrixaceae bacterium]
MPCVGRRRDERGYVLAFAAIIMIPLMAIAGMATDIGSWYSRASEVQKAADAAALAGVVWLPDLAKATAVALDTARANGFDDGAPNISVTVSQLNQTDLRVSITDDDVPVYFSRLFLDDMTITRESVGTYVLPVPLGSPKNYFGTGPLAPSPEGIWASINGWCAPKEQGDPFAVGFEGNWPSSGIVCPGDTPNGQHIASPTNQYQYVINVPAGRTSDIVVHLFSPAKTNSYPDTNDGTSITTTFELRAADNTPFNDTDNPLATCNGSGESNPRTYNPGYVASDATFFGQSGWSRFCTIPPSAPSGQYFLGVRVLEGEANSSGVNSYSVMASYGGLGATCDGGGDAMCPAVYGKDWISVLAASASSAADFHLAEIGAEHAGKQMEITLFDPGEGGDYIQIKDPNGNPVRFDYHTADGDYSATNVDRLDVSGCSGFPQIGPGRHSQCRYNERFVVLTVDLPANYATLYPGSKWWKIYYKFTAAVNDRTTWSVRVLGDPVHISR